MHQRLNTADRRELQRIVAIYAVVSALWIFVSDEALGLLIKEPATIVNLSVFKGLLFIALTSYLLTHLIARYILGIRSAEQELRGSQKLLNAVIEGASDAIYVKDREGRYLLCNSATGGFTGKNPAAIIGNNDTFIFPASEAECLMERDREIIASGRTITVEEPLTDAGGDIRTFLSTKGPLYDGQGNIYGLFGITRDITLIKRAEDVLRRANEDLEKRVSERTAELVASRTQLERQHEELTSTYRKLTEETNEHIRAIEALREQERLLILQSRMAAMGDMLGNIAHQWRQPLNVLGMKVQQLALAHEDGSFSRELLDGNVDDVMIIVKSLSQTIDDCLRLASPDREKSRFSVNEIVRRTVSLISESFNNRQISVEILAAEELLIEGYPNEYAQVLLNILMNARDACIDKQPEKCCITVRLFNERGKTVVTVTDTAGGIGEEIYARIFDAFFTTKQLGKGTGVGLFMAKTIIENNMGGKLTARNVADGAEFRIEV